MPRFFVSEENIGEDHIRITGADASHIMRSLRMSTGEHVTVCNMKSREYECVIESFGEGEVMLSVKECFEGLTEPPYKAVLYQALPKGDKMELIIQKAVELGVFEIVPFISERCISRPDKKSMASKLERWNKIALEAAKQCGRGIVPAVCEPCSFEEAVRRASNADIRMLLYENEQYRSLRDALESARQNADMPEISLMVGAEGGFSEKEAERACDVGLEAVSLGRRILRCETATISALGAVSYALEL